MTNRVAGFICKYVFSEHESCVTSLVVMGRNDDLDSTYVVWAFAILCGSKQRIKVFENELYRKNSKYWDTQTSYCSCP